jgi:hypothetical protein
MKEYLLQKGFIEKATMVGTTYLLGISEFRVIVFEIGDDHWQCILQKTDLRTTETNQMTISDNCTDTFIGLLINTLTWA